MPQARIQKSIPPVVHRQRECMSREHLNDMRDLPCLGCGAQDATVCGHHLLRTGEHGMGQRSSDQWAVPLCDGRCHNPSVKGSVHNSGDEDAWFMARGIDARAVARALWASRGDLDGMQRIVFRARQMARAA